MAVPPILYPFLGTFIDHVGKRGWLLLVNAGLLICTHVILLTPFSVVPIPPTVPMLLFSLSLSIETLSILTTVPLLTKHVPTGLGLHRSIDSIGSTLFGTVVGMLQDSSSDQEDASKSKGFFDWIYHHFFPVQEDHSKQEREDIQLLGMFLTVAIVLLIACSVFVWGDYHWTDGEGGKSGIVNGVYYNRGTTRPRRRSRRRSSEVLRAMTMEPLFELDDEPDAAEVSLSELESNNVGFHSSQQGAATRESIETLDQGEIHGQHGYERLRRGQNRSQVESSDDDDDEDSQDGHGGDRFGVRIESGDDEIPKHKIAQAHFWIMVWSTLLVASWVVFAVGMSR